MHTTETIARQLARSFVDGLWEADELAERGRSVLGQHYRWLRDLATRLVQAFPGRERPRRQQVERFVRWDTGFLKACRAYQLRLQLRFDDRPSMWPSAGTGGPWAVPAIRTAGELADWLSVTAGQLDWFADRQGRERHCPPGRLRHYHYRWVAKRIGGSARLIEAPKWRLKTIQQKILRTILDVIPPHDVAHGFREHHSVRSYVTPHLGQAVVMCTDLRDFFPSVTRGRVQGVFRGAGYPDEVAALLAALCTNQVPDDVWSSFPQYGMIEDRWHHERLYQQAHLPQGAPTSPALANLVAYRLDCRLHGLSAAAGARYTRYADDLLFSGGRAFAAQIRRFLPHVCAIAVDEGFAVNARKTRIMRQSRRQSAAGLTINQHANIPRDEYDRLKATLYNCVHYGPASQNTTGILEYRAHLAGRVAYVESVNAHRGRRLRTLFQQIRW